MTQRSGRRGQTVRAEFEGVIGRCERVDNRPCRMHVDGRQVLLALGWVDRPRKTLGAKGELRIDSRLVAARVNSMPIAVEVECNQAVQEWATVVDKTLVAETGWYRARAQHGGEQV